MECPHCDAPMDTFELGVVIDVCPTCAGIWFDPGEVEQYVSRVAEDQEPEGAGLAGFVPASSSAVACPRCGKASLQLGTVRGLEVGRCTECGGVFAPRSAVVAVSRGDPQHGTILDRAEDIGWDALSIAAVIRLLQLLF
jgi:Zn-finger nucleic acid-binding protein